MDLFIEINKIKDVKLRGIFFGLLKRIEQMEGALMALARSTDTDPATLIEYEGD